MTDEELSRRLTESLDARIRRAEVRNEEKSELSENQKIKKRVEEKRKAAQDLEKNSNQIKVVSARRMQLRIAAAAVFTIVALGGGALLLSHLSKRSNPSATGPSDPFNTAQTYVSTESNDVEKEPSPSGTIYYLTEFYATPCLYQTASYRTNNNDKTIAALIDDYDVMSTDRQGRYVLNKSVCKSIETKDNADGSRTVTVVLQDGLCWNNGEPITATDYLVSALIDLSPALAAEGVDNSVQAAYFEGGTAYMAGEADTISGLKRIDEHSYSVTIPADAVERYYDCVNVSLRPLNAALFGAKAETDGEQVRLSYLSPDGLDLERGRTTCAGRVCAGPYRIEGYDEETNEMILRVNEYYAGNFEGQKPGVESIVIRHFGMEDDFSQLPKEQVYYIPRIQDADLNQYYQKIEQTGALKSASYLRDGYGYLLYECDMGPTQFRAVRQALACLIDRERFAMEFCQGYGVSIDGPYIKSSWEYLHNAAELEQQLDSYSYDPDRAVALLEEDGWVLAEDGSAYVSGLRWKEVTPEQAGNYTHNVTLPDGRILMPLLIESMRSEGGSVTDLLDEYTEQNLAVIDAGMRVHTAALSFDMLLDCLNRAEWTFREDNTWYYIDGENRTGPNNFCLTRLSQQLLPKYDFSSEFGMNGISHYDIKSELAQRSRQMLQATDDADFAAQWKDFILEWNRELPYIPIYANIYYDYMDPKIRGLKPDSYWPFDRAVLYATIEEKMDETGKEPDTSAVPLQTEAENLSEIAEIKEYGLDGSTNLSVTLFPEVRNADLTELETRGPMQLLTVNSDHPLEKLILPDNAFHVVLEIPAVQSLDASKAEDMVCLQVFGSLEEATPNRKTERLILNGEALEALTAFRSAKRIDLCGPTNLSLLSAFPLLKELGLGFRAVSNTVWDLSPIKSLSLTTLCLEDYAELSTAELETLSGASIPTLEISDNSVHDLSVLAYLPDTRCLRLSVLSAAQPERVKDMARRGIPCGPEKVGMINTEIPKEQLEAFAAENELYLVLR